MNLFQFLRDNTLWLVLLSYSTGIVMADHGLKTFWPPDTWFILCLVIATLAGCYSARMTPAIPLLLISFCLGISSYTTALKPGAGTTDLSSLYGKKGVTLCGQVVSIDPQPGRWRMDILLEKIRNNTLTTTAKGKLRIHIKSSGDQNELRQHILPGNTVIFSAKLHQPRLFDIPGEFNYPRYLANLGIFTTATMTQGTRIIRVAKKNNLSWRQTIERWRYTMGNTIEKQFQPQQSAYLLSLSLGQKTRFSPQQREQLAACGISHLFSISGLHLGLLAGLVYLLINTLYRRSEFLLLMFPAQKAAAILSLPILLFYLPLSGSAIPTLRAAALIATGVVVLLLNRHTPPIKLLALVALMILGSTPLALFSPSFQLSFAGVSAILLCVPTMQRFCHTKLTQRLILPLWVTFVATLSTAPIALWHFHTFAPAALICNLFAIPMIGMGAMPLALSGTLLFTISPDIAAPLLRVSNRLVELTLNAALHIAQGPLAVSWHYFSPWHNLIITMVCISVLCCCANSWRAGTLSIAVTIFLSLAYIAQPAQPPLQLTAFSVGQGDALLLRTTGKNYLIDGGGFYGSSFDVGKRLLAPALGHLGVNHLDAVILSHDHPDHRKGLIYILKTFSVDRFWCSIPKKQLHPSLQDVLAQQKIPFQLFLPGWTKLETDHGTSLDLFVAAGSTNMNDQSLVVLAHQGEDGVLLTGDLERQGVEQMLSQPLPERVTLLKLPHHGSRHSAPKHLVQATTPKIAIATVGYKNRYGFPHHEVIVELEKAGAKLIRTDLDGTVQFSSTGHGWSLTKL